jgi:hypothetical protein
MTSASEVCAFTSLSSERKLKRKGHSLAELFCSVRKMKSPQDVCEQYWTETPRWVCLMLLIKRRLSRGTRGRCSPWNRTGKSKRFRHCQNILYDPANSASSVPVFRRALLAVRLNPQLFKQAKSAGTHIPTDLAPECKICTGNTEFAGQSRSRSWVRKHGTYDCSNEQL